MAHVIYTCIYNPVRHQNQVRVDEKNGIKGERKMKPGLRFMENMDLLSRDD